MFDRLVACQTGDAKDWRVPCEPSDSGPNTPRKSYCLRGHWKTARFGGSCLSSDCDVKYENLRLAQGILLSQLLMAHTIKDWNGG